MTVHEIDQNGLKNHRPMVNEQNPYTKSAAIVQHGQCVNPWAKAAEDDSWSWDRRSSGTSISWPEDMEEAATKKVIDQWEAVQRTLYDENDQVSSEVLLAECVQWRTQRPHLRVLGKGVRGPEASNERIEDLSSTNVSKNNNAATVEEIIEEHKVPESIPLKQMKHAREDLPEEEYREQTRKEVLDLILDFVCTELLTNKEEDESLGQNLDTVLRITPAPTYSGRNPLRNHSTANEFIIPTYHRIKLHKDDNRDCSNALEFSERLPEVNKNNSHADKSGRIFVGRGNIMSISARRQRDMRDVAADGILIKKDRLYTPQLPRNALGTVFTEKIIVSPVPFATSTKESFSTLKSTPLRSMRLSLDSSLIQRSARSVNSVAFKGTPTRRAGLLQIPQVHSAWQAPVCPTVWPKNVKLAPIDVTRLPSSRRRSLATALTQPRRSRNSLSPIPRELMPVSPLIREPDTKSLEIHGKQIAKQKCRTAMKSAGWDSSPRNVKKLAKNNQSNNER